MGIDGLITDCAVLDDNLFGGADPEEDDSPFSKKGGLFSGGGGLFDDEQEVRKSTGVAEIGISMIVSFSALLRRICDLPVVMGGGNLCSRRKPQPNSKSLVNLSHASPGI